MKNHRLVLILTGGESPRFKSSKPKVLHPLLGKPVVSHVLDAVLAAGNQVIWAAVKDWGEESVDVLSEAGAEIIRQKDSSGAGGALFQARRALQAHDRKDLLVLQANLPLLTAASLRALLARHEKSGDPATVLVPRGMPSEDFSAKTSCSVCVFKIRELLNILPNVPRRKNGTFAINDIVASLSASQKIGLCRAGRIEELFEVETRYDLSLAAAVLRLRKIRELSHKGVTVLDPPSTWIDLDVQIGRETIIYPSVVIEGHTQIGGHCRIYPHAHITNSRIGDHGIILSSTVIEESLIENQAQVGPFSRLRPGTVIKASARVGNFVEMKNTVFGRRSKAQHLSYLGDTKVGEDVNVGAGTITCNYDGVNKNKTVIESGAFIGSGTELVAPVRIGKKAYIAAGSAITKDVSPGALAIGRARQVEKPGWAEKKAARRTQRSPKNKKRP